MSGWIKIFRSLQDNPLWTCEPFTRGQAWVDLLLLANHKYSYFYKRNIKIEVQRGQVGRSEVELADRWKWSRSKVRKFLNDLEKEQQIVQQKTTVTQLITLVNYDEYQKKEQQDVQQQDSRKTAERQQQDTYKNDKNVKNDKEDTSADEPPIYCTMDKDQFKEWYNNTEHQDQHKCRALMERYKHITGISYYYDKKEIGQLSQLLKKFKSKDKKQSFRAMLNFMIQDEYFKDKITFAQMNSLFNNISEAINK